MTLHLSVGRTSRYSSSAARTTNPYQSGIVFHERKFHCTAIHRQHSLRCGGIETDLHQTYSKMLTEYLFFAALQPVLFNWLIKSG